MCASNKLWGLTSDGWMLEMRARVRVMIQPTARKYHAFSLSALSAMRFAMRGQSSSLIQSSLCGRLSSSSTSRKWSHTSSFIIHLSFMYSCIVDSFYLSFFYLQFHLCCFRTSFQFLVSFPLISSLFFSLFLWLDVDSHCKVERDLC